MIFQQVMNDVVGQAVAFGVVPNAAVRLASKEPVGGCDPQRTAAVFQQVIYENLLWMSASHFHVHGPESETIVLSLQTVKVFHRSAPDRAAAIFVEHIDGAGLTVFVFRNYDGEHRR